MTLSSSGVAAACGTEPCGSAPCGSGPRPRKGGLQPPGRIPEAFIVPVSGAPYPRRGAMVVPSGIAQAVPGRSHLAILGQIGPSRHHHCPAHSAAEPPRDITPSGPFFLRSWTCRSGPRPRKGGFSLPAGSQRHLLRQLKQGFWNAAGRLCRPFACRQAPTNLAS